MTQPFKISQVPGQLGQGVVDFDGAGNQRIDGALTAAALIVDQLPANPVQTPRAVTLFTTDGVTLRSIGNDGVAKDVGGGAPAPTIRQTYLTAGAVTFNSDAAFTVYPATAWSIAAVAGETVAVQMVGMWQPAGSDFLDLAVTVAGSPVLWSSSGTATPTVEGDPSLYSAAGFIKMSGPWFITVTSGMLSGGNLTIMVGHKGAPGGVLYANANYPLRQVAINYHVTT